MEDLEKIDRIKSNLRAYLRDNPNAENAAKVKQILVNFTANAPSLPSPSHQMKNPTDEELGLEQPPVKDSMADRLTLGDPATVQSNAQSALDRAATTPSKPPEMDPMTGAIAQQAALMGALQLLGGGLSIMGNTALRTGAGKAAKFLSEEGVPFKAPPKPFGPSAEADALEQGADEFASSNPYEADIARAREAVRLKPPHMTLHSGSLGLALSPFELALRNAGPLAGRAALPLTRAGQAVSAAGMAPGVGGNPLFNAVEGR